MRYRRRPEDSSAVRLLYSTPQGEIYEESNLQALAFGEILLQEADLIPLPDGATLSMMPNRLAVGLKRSGERQVLAKSRGWAVAALLPIGYTRTQLPAYEKLPDTDPLPFFGYCAVADINGRLYVAAVKTDDPHKWHPQAFSRQKLEHLVHERRVAFPNNRIIGQHAHCALDYSCPTASNLFFGRWEMAIARLQLALHWLYLQARRGRLNLTSGSLDLYSHR
jgi:hypothetical protein